MALGCIFISRGGSAEELQKIVDEIDERQRMIEDFGEFPPVIIFPEGGTSNSSCILPFKKGAFLGMRAVKPIFVRYRFGTMS